MKTSCLGILFILFTLNSFAGFEDSTVTTICTGSYEGITDPPTETYDVYSSTGLLKFSTSYIVENNVHIENDSTSYLYDISGNLISRIDSNWLYRAYISKKEYYYSYDASGNVLTYEYIEATNSSIGTHSKKIYTYDINGNLLTERDSAGTPLLPSSYTINQYDLSDNLISTIVNGQSRTDYQWNLFGRETTRTNYSWINNSWTPSTQTVNTYQQNDTVLTSTFHQVYDSLLGWFTQQYDTLFYDPSNFLLMNLNFSNNNGVMDTSSRTIYTYYSFVPVSYHRSFDYYSSPGIWEQEFWGDDSYDLEGRLISTYGSCNGCGEGSGTHTYDYHDLLIAYSSYNISHGGISESSSCHIYYYSIHGTFIICQGEDVILVADSGFTSYLWSTGETTQSINVNTGGVYSVLLTNAIGETWQAAPFTVGVKTPPVASYAVDSTLYICRGQYTPALNELDLPGYSYRWLLNDQPFNFHGIDPGRNFLYVYSSIYPSGSYRVRVFNECGFDTSSATNIIFSPNSIPSIFPVSATICYGDSIELTASGGNNYLWVPSLDTSASIYVSRKGNYKVFVSNGGGCQTEVDFTLAVSNYKNADIILNSDTILSFYQSDGYPSSYHWMLNGDTIPGADSYQYYAQQAGTYQLILNNSYGCIDTLPAFQFGSFNVFAGDDIETCNGRFTSLGGASSVWGGKPPYNFTWTKNGSLVSAGAQPYAGYFQYSFQPVTTTNDTSIYVLSVTDSLGANDSDTLQLIVRPSPPVPFVTSDLDSVCFGLTANLTAFPNGNYVWLRNGMNPSFAYSNHYSVDYAAIVSCTYPDEFGCYSDTSNQVSIFTYPPLNPPVLTLMDTAVKCFGQSILLTASYDSSFVYEWRANSGQIINSSSDSLFATWTDKYYVRVKNNSGCMSYYSQPVHVEFDTAFRFPIAVQFSTVRCYGDSVRMSSSIHSGYVYQWMKDNQPVHGANDSVFYAKETGNYFLMLSDSSGCSGASDVWLVQVRPMNVVTVTQIDSLLNASARFTSTYQWYDGSLFLAGEDSNIFIGHQPGNYLVQAIDYHGCGCYSDSIPLFISPLSVPQIDENHIYVYPNPANGYFIVKCDLITPAGMEIYIGDVNEKEIYHSTLFKAENLIDINHLSKGIYFLKIINERKPYVYKLTVL